MANELAIQPDRADALAAYKGANNPFTAMGNEVGNFSLFTKFDGNTGEWSFGKDKELIEPGTKIVMNIDSLERGWICWKDSVLMAEIMNPYPSMPLVSEKKLEDFGPYAPGTSDGWSEQMKIVMAFLEDGRNLEYKTSAAGGRNALSSVIGEFGQNMHLQQADGQPKMPIVELGSESFMAKPRKDDPDPAKRKAAYKKFAPTFEIVDWLSIAEMNALSTAAAMTTQDEEVRGAIDAAHEIVNKEDKKKKKKKKKKEKKMLVAPQEAATPVEDIPF